MPEEYIISYDHGTSGMKTALISTKGEVIGFNFEEYDITHDSPGAAEQCPSDWWDALQSTTKKLLDQDLIPRNQIIAISTSNQMSGTIPINKDGKTLHNCITWLDTRGSKCIFDEFGGAIEGYNPFQVLRWLRKTGGVPGLSGKDIIAHILWLKETHPKIYENTWKFLDCKDYINYRLTGKIASSYDCAILTWLVNDKDPDKIYYDPSLLSKVDLDREKFPDIYPSTKILGNILPNIAAEFDLPQSIKVVLGAGDMTSAAIGSGAIKNGEYHICIGSSSWVMTHTPHRKVDLTHFIGSIPSAIPGKYVCVGEQESAGINLTWLRDKFLYNKDALLIEEEQPDVYKIFDKLVADCEPGARKVIFTPWLFGERAPIEDPLVRGTLFNLSLDIDRTHILRAIFEGVAFNSRWVFELEQKLLRNKAKFITLIGGGAVSDVWCQIYADILKTSIKQIYHAKTANSVGAALIASVALNKISWEEVPNLIKIKKIFQPRPEYFGLYDDLFSIFKKIYHRNKRLYHDLNEESYACLDSL